MAEKDEKQPAADAAKGTGEILEGIAGVLPSGEDGEPSDERKGVKAAADGAKAVEHGVKAAKDTEKAVKAIEKEDVGGAAGSIGSAAGNLGGGAGQLLGGIGDAFPEGSDERRDLGRAAQATRTTGQVAQGLGRLTEAGASVLDGLAGTPDREDVHFHLEIEGLDIPWTVTEVSLAEALDQVGHADVVAWFPLEQAVDEEDLLAKEVTLSIERGDQRRHFKGLVRRGSSQSGQEHNVLRLDVVPALWLCTQEIDSRIYQGLTVPALVDQLVRERLGKRNRSVRDELTDTYEPHEYLVQVTAA